MKIERLLVIYFKTIFLVALYVLPPVLRPWPNENHSQAKNIANPEISRVSYSSSGGKSGNYENLDISKISLTYVQGRRGVERTINEKTVKSFWDRLTKSINLKDFDNIRSDPGHALYDGIDLTISIEKATKKHVIINGNEDSVNYARIRPFTDLLEHKIAELREKIIW